MDLGIARLADQTHALTSTRQALGSLDFVAPEKRRAAALLVSRAPRLDLLRHTLPPPLANLMQQMLLPNAMERCDMAVVERLKSISWQGCGCRLLALMERSGGSVNGSADDLIKRSNP